MGGFSGIVYRCSRIANSKYSRSGGSMVPRSSRIAAVCGGNRMMSGVSRSSSAPWALMPCMLTCSECFGTGFSLYSLANKETYNTYITGSENPRILGSSQWWVSIYDKMRRKLFLSEPLANRVIHLPPLDTLRLNSVVPGDDARLALATFGDNNTNLAFFSRRRRRSYEWIPLVNPNWGEKKRVYDGVVYSSRHKRLFCLTSPISEDDEDGESKLELECWDLELESPMVEETMEIEIDLLVKETRKLKYLVLAEHTGQMYVVVRYTASRDDNKFDVYKIEREGGRARGVRMEDSLEGVAMFLGNNQRLAMAAEEHSGLNPNCLYFSDDNRYSLFLMGSDKMPGNVLDYQTKEISPLPFRLTDPLLFPYPTWFVPRPA